MPFQAPLKISHTIVDLTDGLTDSSAYIVQNVGQYLVEWTQTANAAAAKDLV